MVAECVLWYLPPSVATSIVQSPPQWAFACFGPLCWGTALQSELQSAPRSFVEMGSYLSWGTPKLRTNYLTLLRTWAVSGHHWSATRAPRQGTASTLSSQGRRTDMPCVMHCDHSCPSNLSATCCRNRVVLLFEVLQQFLSMRRWWTCSNQVYYSTPLKGNPLWTGLRGFPCCFALLLCTRRALLERSMRESLVILPFNYNPIKFSKLL